MPDGDQEVDLTSEPEGEGGLILPRVVEVDEVELVESTATPAAPVGDDQVDLTVEAPPVQGLTKPDAVAARERYRGWLALSSLALLAGVLVAAYIGVITERVSAADTKDFLAITLPAVTALTGGAVAFYFGAERSTRH